MTAAIIKFPGRYRPPPPPDDYPPLVPELFDDPAWLHQQLRDALFDVQVLLDVLAARERAP